MSKIIIMINGAPRSGKDSVAKELAELIQIKQGKSVRIISFADQLKGIINYEYIYPDGNLSLEELKIKYPSFRQVIIGVAENVIKPIFGEDFFAKNVLDKIRNSNEEVFIIPDLGFYVEYELFSSSEFSMFLIHLYRDGTTFVDDSREELDLPFNIVVSNGDITHSSKLIYEKIYGK